MIDEKVEEEIQNLKDQLQNYEDTDPAYMSEEMKELRHYVMYTHLRMEESLGSLITRSILEPFLPQDNVFTEKHQSAFRAGTASMIEVDYYRKVQLAQASGQINNQVQTLMARVNNLRMYFSHPSKYYDKLQELKSDRGKYKEALEDLIAAHREMNKIFSQFLPNKKTK